MQYHVLLSRINPSLKIDLVRFCTVENGQAKSFTVDEFDTFCSTNHLTSLMDLILHSDISDSMYIRHADIFDLVDILSTVGPVTLDYFDNNFVIIFDYGTEEETSQEK